MDKPNDECLLFTNTNKNIENLKKAYSNGCFSMAEILEKTELNVDFETMTVAANSFIPDDLLNKNLSFENAIKQKIEVKKESLPTIHIPGKVFFTDRFDSCLTKREQALCLNTLKLKQSGCNVSKLSKVQNQDLMAGMALQPKVQEENIRFVEYVKSDWKEKNDRALRLKETIKSYAYVAWQKKLASVYKYSQMYKPHSIIPFSIQETESKVSVSHVGNLLEIGVVPKFIQPCLEFKHTLKIQTLPLANSFLHTSKLSVSQDPNISELLKTTSIDVVVSSSGIKQLMDDTNFNTEWTIPVVVKTQSGNAKKTVVHIDKPLPKRFPSPIDFNYYCQKLLVKTNFCCYPGIIYNSNDVEIQEDSIIDIEEHEDPPKKKRKGNSNSDSYLQQLDQFTKLLEHGKSQIDDAVKKTTGKRTIFHNASYRIWNIKYNNEQNELLKTKHTSKDIKVLIRCKLDACKQQEDGTIQPLIVVPKLEYQLEHGANIPTKKELIDQWSALFFRPFSHLYRVRMQCNTSEVVDVESVSLQKINSEANTFYKYQPHLRLDILCEIFAKLAELNVGNYVLRYDHNRGPFVEIFGECNSSVPGEKFDFHKFYSKEVCSYLIPKSLCWIPIDTTYILPVHNTFKRMPGMFRPLIRQISNKGKKKKAKKGKKKAKS